MVKDLIPWAALVFAVTCFVFYVVLTLKVVPAAVKAKQAANRVSEEKGLAATPGDVTDLLKAAAALVEALVKAGPALWALIGSMLFLLIAGFAAGVFTTA